MTARELIIDGVQRLLDKHGAQAFRDNAAKDDTQEGDPPTASESSPCVGWALIAVWQDLDDGCTWRFLIDPDKQLNELTAGLISYATNTNTL